MPDEYTDRTCAYCSTTLPTGQMNLIELPLLNSGPYPESIWTCKDPNCIAQGINDREESIREDDGRDEH